MEQVSTPDFMFEAGRLFKAEAWLRCRLKQVVVSVQLGCWFLHKKGQYFPRGLEGPCLTL